MIKWDRPCYKCLSHFCDLSCKETDYLKPSQHKWIGLTDDEIYSIDWKAEPNYARAIEAKLKEKNT